MHSATDQFDRLIWRYVRDSGGWHTRREIADALALDRSGRMKLARTLRRLVKDGRLVLRPDMSGNETVGVTALCWPPDGLSLEPDDVEVES
ncbi:hypothetical protein [Ralstonia mannitolilytica]|uniref:hypothetical protein n=1 Tax=Ralstonia mannitolilytica TaxID=105219 RepID=UPI0028F6A409|nr:hypothetical protein [Ralstonia mannitolilytica]CAJ0889200.1 hypothetical protein R76727_04081 [Ralstonia mannitolilytica]